MNRHEDDIERLLRMIDERRKGAIDSVARGGVSAENIAGGYRDVTGYVKGLDDAEELVRKVLRPTFDEPFEPSTKSKPPGIGDY